MDAPTRNLVHNVCHACLRPLLLLKEEASSVELTAITCVMKFDLFSGPNIAIFTTRSKMLLLVAKSQR